MLYTPNFSFKFDNYYTGRARTGVITTPHGIIETPTFVFCATKAAIKGISSKQLQEIGTQVILSNTYHLMLQPGKLIVDNLGGLQEMTGWKGPMLTDSGGFQIFSLGYGSFTKEIKENFLFNNRKTLIKIDDSGATFKSYLDGSLHKLTPEKSIQIQRKLGADLIVVLDECTSFHENKEYIKMSMERSHLWAKRSLNEFNIINNGKQSLYGIIQGGVYKDLRIISTDFINANDFFGYAIGGSLGVDRDQMDSIVEFTVENLSPNRPIHLLGIGSIRDIFSGVMQGIDSFDSVHPTRLARHGGALVQPDEWEGIDFNLKESLNLRNSIFSSDDRPISGKCFCNTCRSFSRGYLHYLLKAKEMLAFQAISLHNIYFINQLMLAIRNSLSSSTFEEERKKWVSY